MIIHLEFKYFLNHIPSNQDNDLQQQDLRQWMNEMEQNYQKDKERIRQICKNITSKAGDFYQNVGLR